MAGPTSKAEWDRWAAMMKPELATLGADPKALTAVRLSRLPQVFRADRGRYQKLIYLDPMPPSGRRIMDRPPRRDVLHDARMAATAAGWGDDAQAAQAAAIRVRYYLDGLDGGGDALDAQAGKLARLLPELDALAGSTVLLGTAFDA